MVLIFYKNNKSHKKTEEKNLIFSIFGNGVVEDVDDLLAKPNECKICYNLNFKNGALKTGLGFAHLKAPEAEDTPIENWHTFKFADFVSKIDDIWLNRWFNTNTNKFVYQIWFYEDSTKILWTVPLIDEFAGEVWQRTVLVKSYPTYVCEYRIDNEDSTVFFTNDGIVYLTRDTDYTYDAPAMISCLVHYDNFFGITNTNRNTLIYTTNLNLKEWADDNSSAIEFLDNRGSFTKLVGFNDYVYLFREHGITKLSIYTTKNDFSCTHLYTSTSKIYEKSVCVCGDKIFFVTRDGLYSFNGNSVSRIGEKNDKYLRWVDNSNCCAVSFNGKYYLATKYDFDDGVAVGAENESDCVNNVLFEIDIDTFDMNIYRGVDIKTLLAVDSPIMSKLCACYNSTENKNVIGELTFDGKTFNENTEKLWMSYNTDLGYRGKRKKVKELVINSLYSCVVDIESDEDSCEIEIVGDEKEQRVPLNVCGKNFQFTFKTSEQFCEISKPMIVFDVVQ